MMNKNRNFVIFAAIIVSLIASFTTVYGCLMPITYQFEDKYEGFRLNETTLVRVAIGTNVELYRNNSGSASTLEDMANYYETYDVIVYRDDYRPYRLENFNVFSTGNPAVFELSKRVCSIDVETPLIGGSSGWFVGDTIELFDRFFSTTEEYIHRVELSMYDLDHTIIFEVFNSSGALIFEETVDVVVHTKINESGNIIENEVTSVSTTWMPEYDDKYTFTFNATVNDGSCIDPASDSGTTYLNIYQNASGLILYDVVASPDTIYPNIIGNDTVSISASVSTKNIPYSIIIREDNWSGNIVKTFSGTTNNNKIVVPWDGRDDGGDVVGDGDYHINISVSDFNNHSAEASQFVYVDTAAADSIPPVIEVIYPSNNEVIGNTTPEIILSIYDIGLEVNYIIFLFKLDGDVKVLTINAGSPFLTYTPDAPLSDGEHTIFVSVEDNYGNQAVLEQSFFIDSDAPILGNITITPNPVDAGEVVSVSVFASDVNGIASVVARINGTDHNMSENNGSEYVCSFNAPSTPTEYTVTVFATDSVGNVAQETEILEVRAIEVRYNDNVGWVSIDSPASSTSGATINVEGVLQNNGVNNGVDINVTLFVDNTAVSSGLYNIPAENMTNLSFAWIAQKGTHNLTLVALMDSDENADDNEIMTTIIVTDPEQDDGGNTGGGGGSSYSYVAPVVSEQTLNISYVDINDTLEKGRIYYISAKVTNIDDTVSDVILSAEGLGISGEISERISPNRYKIIKLKWIVPKDIENGSEDIIISVSDGTYTETFTKSVEITDFKLSEPSVDKSVVDPDEEVIVNIEVPVYEDVTFYLDGELYSTINSADSNEVSEIIKTNESGQHIITVETLGSSFDIGFSVNDISDEKVPYRVSRKTTGQTSSALNATTQVIGTPVGHLLVHGDGKLSFWGWILLLLLAIIIGLMIRLIAVYRRSGKVGFYEGDTRTDNIAKKFSAFFAELFEEDDFDDFGKAQKQSRENILDDIKAEMNRKKKISRKK